MNTTTPSFFSLILTSGILALAWMLAQKIQHATVQYAISVVRKLMTIFLIAPVLVFFLCLGADCGFSGKAAASEWYLLMHPDLTNTNLESPTVKDSEGRIILSEPRDKDELIERIGGGISMTYWIGLIAGIAYIFLQCMILGENKPLQLAQPASKDDRKTGSDT